jgi:hypothetical protein
MGTWYLRLPRMTLTQRHAIVGTSLIVEDEDEVDEPDNKFFEDSSICEESSEAGYEPDTESDTESERDLKCPNYNYREDLDDLGLIIAFGVFICTVSYALSLVMGTKANAI